MLNYLGFLKERTQFPTRSVYCGVTLCAVSLDPSKACLKEHFDWLPDLTRAGEKSETNAAGKEILAKPFGWQSCLGLGF